MEYPLLSVKPRSPNTAFCDPTYYRSNFRQKASLPAVWVLPLAGVSPPFGRSSGASLRALRFSLESRPQFTNAYLVFALHVHTSDLFGTGVQDLTEALLL